MCSQSKSRLMHLRKYAQLTSTYVQYLMYVAINSKICSCVLKWCTYIIMYVYIRLLGFVANLVIYIYIIDWSYWCTVMQGHQKSFLFKATYICHFLPDICVIVSIKSPDDYWTTSWLLHTYVCKADFVGIIFRIIGT